MGCLSDQDWRHWRGSCGVSRSTVQERAIDRTAALVALYTLNPSKPLDAAIEAFKTIEPPSWSSRSAFCTVNRSPFTVIPNILSKCASVIAPNGTNSQTPAFANKMSIWPFSFLIVAYNRSRSARFETWLWTPVTFRPISSTAASSSLCRRPVIKTWAPSATNRCAVASPRPLLSPVMTAIFPSSFLMVFILVGRF